MSMIASPTPRTLSVERSLSWKRLWYARDIFQLLPPKPTSPQARYASAEAGMFNDFHQAIGIRPGGIILDICHLSCRIDVNVHHSWRPGQSTLDNEHPSSTATQVVHGQCDPLVLHSCLPFCLSHAHSTTSSSTHHCRTSF